MNNPKSDCAAFPHEHRCVASHGGNHCKAPYTQFSHCCSNYKLKRDNSVILIMISKSSIPRPLILGLQWGREGHGSRDKWRISCPLHGRQGAEKNRKELATRHHQTLVPKGLLSPPRPDFLVSKIFQKNTTPLEPSVQYMPVGDIAYSW